MSFIQLQRVNLKQNRGILVHRKADHADMFYAIVYNSQRERRQNSSYELEEIIYFMFYRKWT